MLTDRCNLRCIYCYGSSDSTGDDMPLEIGRAVVETIGENALRQKTGSIEIGFHGGGEPTLNWDVLVGVIDCAEELSKREKLELRTTICTNGVMIEDRMKWLAEHIGHYPGHPLRRVAMVSIGVRR
jgi:uncharacterized protein